ncbi:MAG: S8 family serine peptidase [Spirochaetaceae bacterium]
MAPADVATRSGAGGNGSAQVPVVRTAAAVLPVIAFVVFFLFMLSACRNPTVVEYEPYESPGAVEPNDEYYELQWHYRQINMPGAWGILHDSELEGAFDEVMVAVIDNGILEEDDLKDNLFLDTTGPDGGYEFDGEDGDGDPTADDNNSHGTHVSGTIAAVTDNDNGVSGIGWDRLKVMPVRALRGEGDGTTTDIINSIYYSAQSDESGVEPPTRDSRVMNLSLGGNGSDPAMYEAIDYAIAQGMTVVAAAGNSGGTAIYPAAFDNTIAVSAVTKGEMLAWYSSRGPAIDFTAPGGDEEGIVWSVVDGGYDGYAGTSMATPHVSGVVGLLYSYAPNLNQDAVYAILANTAKDLGEPGHDEEYGHGLIDAEAALEYLINAGRDYPVQPRSSGGGTSSGTSTGGSTLQTAGGGAVGGGRPRVSNMSDAAVSRLAAEGAGRSRGRRPQKRTGAIMPDADAEYDEHSVIVKLSETAREAPDGAAAGSPEAAAAVAAAAVDAAGSRHLGGPFHRIDLPHGMTPQVAIEALGEREDVEYAQPNYRYRLID